MSDEEKRPHQFPQEAAEKVLLADLANILKKAKSGKPLSKHERELVEEHTGISQAPRGQLREGWTINRLSDETGIDRRTLKRILADTKQQEDGSYWLRDFVLALIAYHCRDDSETELVREKVRLTAADADIREVERAQIRNQVLDTETVFRVWENICISIRRTIVTAPLADAQKDAILHELRTLDIQDYVEQQELDEGTGPENAADLQPAGAA